MVEFKKATAEDGRMLRELFEEFVDLDAATLSDKECRTAYGQAESMVNALVADEDTEGRLWMDVPEAMSVLADTQTYLQRLWGELMSRNMPEADDVQTLLIRVDYRLQDARNTESRAHEVISQHLESGDVIIGHRKVRKQVRKLFGED